jgi:hypothetical protein
VIFNGPVLTFGEGTDSDTYVSVLNTLIRFVVRINDETDVIIYAVSNEGCYVRKWDNLERELQDEAYLIPWTDITNIHVY